MENNVAAVFESWSNGGLQLSALYLASVDGQEKVDSFIEMHFQSNTFAALHAFEDEEFAKSIYLHYRRS